MADRLTACNSVNIKLPVHTVVVVVVVYKLQTLNWFERGTLALNSCQTSSIHSHSRSFDIQAHSGGGKEGRVEERACAQIMR